MKPLSSKAVTLLAATCASTTVYATNGAMPQGYGIKAMGMGGVGIAFPQDSIAAATNPAGMVLVGDRLDVGAAVLFPKITTEFNGTSYNGNGMNAIVVPDFGYNKMIGTDQSVGISIYGNGVGSQYSSNFLLPGQPNIYSNLTQVIFSPTYAFKITPNHSIGISINGAYQTFKVNGFAPFMALSSGQNPATASDPGSDNSWGIGAQIGWNGQITDDLTLGAVYVSETYMGKLTKYQNFLAGNGSLNIPAHYGLGFAYKITPSLTLAGDAMQIMWGSINSLGNNVTSNILPLGGVNSSGLGWKNQTLGRIGLNYAINESWTIRGGYSQGTEILQGSQLALNVISPITTTSHATIGTTWSMGEGYELSAMYGYAFNNKVNNTGGQLPPLNNISMSQNWAGLELGIKFK